VLAGFFVQRVDRVQWLFVDDEVPVGEQLVSVKFGPVAHESCCARSGEGMQRLLTAIQLMSSVSTPIASYVDWARRSALIKIAPCLTAVAAINASYSAAPRTPLSTAFSR